MTTLEKIAELRNYLQDSEAVSSYRAGYLQSFA